MRIVTIPISVWRCYVVCYCGGERVEAFTRFAKHCRIKDTPTITTFNPDATTLCSDATKDAAIWFKHTHPSPGVLAHEAVHAATHILKVSGANDEESFAYLVQFIIEEFNKSKRQNGRRYKQ